MASCLRSTKPGNPAIAPSALISSSGAGKMAADRPGKARNVSKAAAIDELRAQQNPP
jgi:hypothetical protein